MTSLLASRLFSDLSCRQSTVPGDVGVGVTVPQCSVVQELALVVVNRRHQCLVVRMMTTRRVSLNQRPTTPATSRTPRVIQRPHHQLRLLLRRWQQQLKRRTQRTSSASSVESCLPMLLAHNVSALFVHTHYIMAGSLAVLDTSKT